MADKVGLVLHRNYHKVNPRFAEAKMKLCYSCIGYCPVAAHRPTQVVFDRWLRLPAHKMRARARNPVKVAAPQDPVRVNYRYWETASCFPCAPSLAYVQLTKSTAMGRGANSGGGEKAKAWGAAAGPPLASVLRRRVV